MDFDLASLPDNQSLSKEQALLLLRSQEEHFQIEQEKFQAKIDYLEEQLRLLKNELFGRKSEKPIRQDRDQIPLFNRPGSQAEQTADLAEETVAIPAHSRRKSGRKPLPEDLPRVEVIHDLSEAEKMCACGHIMSRVGQEVCEKLDYVPAKIQSGRGTLVQKVHNLSIRSSTSGFFPVAMDRLMQDVVTPKYLATSAPE